MANAGKLVTNAEVSGFVGTIDEFKIREEIIVKAAEKIVDNIFDLTLLLTTYTDEPYDVKLELVWGSIVQKPANIIRLLQLPVSTFTELKVVTDRDKTTGAVISSTTLNKNEYFVKLSSGIITLFETSFAASERLFPSFINPNSLSSFPAGVARLLATYVAGYDEKTVPHDIKLLILQIVGRMHRLVKDNHLNVTAIQSDFGVTTLLRTMFTPEEMMIIKFHRRPVLV